MMHVSESLAAVAFYAGLIALCAGAVLGARAAVERKKAPLAIPLLALGAVGLAGALIAYANGPRGLLPF
jgi:uncharacterized membrane protein HdeD (DUF308 family)